MDAPDALILIGNLIERAQTDHEPFKTGHEAGAVLTNYTAKVKNLNDGPKCDNYQEELGRRISHVAVVALRALVDLSLPFGTELADEDGLATDADRVDIANTRIPPPAGTA